MLVSFDFGGVLSEYPDQCAALIRALLAGGHQVCMVTGIRPEWPHEYAQREGFRKTYGFPQMTIHYCRPDEAPAHNLPTKWETVMKLSVAIHFDNNPVILKQIRESSAGHVLCLEVKPK